MKTKHTPGPWINEKAGHIVEIAFPSKILATVNIRTNEEIQSIANAKLMGASPDLLNCALLDNCFPMITEKDKEKTFELAKSFGWEMDEPVEIFAMKLRSAAIKKATE